MAPNKGKAKKSKEGKQQREAHCKSCNSIHQRPVGKACTRPPVEATTSQASISESDRESDLTYNSIPALQDPLTALMSKLDSIERQQKQIVDRIVRIESKETVMPPSSSPIRKPMSEPEVIPSLDFLKTNNEIQTEVASRIRQLESRNMHSNPGKNSLKSVRFRSADTQVSHYVAWPQEFVYVGPSRKTVQYDDLTSEQFILGYLRIIQRQNSDTKNIMLNHLTNLLQSTLDFSFEIARGAHAVILQEIERGTLTWQDTEDIERTRSLYTTKITSADSFKGSSDTKRVVCAHYNAGKCRQQNDHRKDNILFRHICTYCYRVAKKTYSHPELAYNRKQKDNQTD